MLSKGTLHNPRFQETAISQYLKEPPRHSTSISEVVPVDTAAMMMTTVMKTTLRSLQEDFLLRLTDLDHLRNLPNPVQTLKRVLVVSISVMEQHHHFSTYMVNGPSAHWTHFVVV